MFWFWVFFRLPLRILVVLAGMLTWFFAIVAIGCWAQGDILPAIGFALTAGIASQSRWVLWQLEP